MTDFQTSVEITTIVFLILSSLLSFYLTKEYTVRKQKSYLYWGIGMWIFALTDLLEVYFAFGLYSQAAAQIYLFLSALLVIPLAMGSLQLIKSGMIRIGYFGYSVITALLLAYFTFTAPVPNMVSGYIVNGNIPINVIIYSSLITFPAMVVLIGVAAAGYLKTRRKKLLWIVLGVLMLGAGGTLYIASFPLSLYVGEFLGIVMLWLGFFDFSLLNSNKRRKR